MQRSAMRWITPAGVSACLMALPAVALGQSGSARGPGASTSPPPAANPAAVTSERIVRAPTAEPHNWLTYHGSYDAQRFSRLDAVTTSNAAGLREAWRMYLPVPHGFEATAIVVDGVMYFTTGGHTAVVAVDARTGQKLWQHQDTVAQDVPACCDWVNRGVAVGNGRIFYVTLDARLKALDARTGQVVWQQTLADYRDGYTATAAPLFVKDKVITGISGGEYGIRGFLDAYDANTGERAWRFWTIPAPGEPGSETWGGDLPTWMTGGGPTWVTGSYDPELDLLYWTTGNPGPDFNGEVRPGDNLYTNAVVALDPDDGTRRWHYQWTPHDVWDYDGVNEVILADLTIQGRPTKALIHADKNGHYYVLDRTDGRFLMGKPYARVTWATGLDPQTGRPMVDSAAMLSSALEPICPGPAGAKEWVHMAFSPQTGMAYLPVIENCANFRLGQPFYRRGLPFWGSMAEPAAMGPGESHGKLMALNATTGERAWVRDTEHPVVASVLTTAGGLVFWGEADGTLHASDARTGQDVWTHKAPMGVHGSPMTYAVDGKQYVAFPVGWGGWINGFAPELAKEPRGHLMMVFALP
jgi:alcohol dehydrogenase (cytochrome c)